MTETATGVERRLELISTVLLALATVATAWAAYQSRQWTGVQSQGYSKATANRIAENRFAVALLYPCDCTPVHCRDW